MASKGQSITVVYTAWDTAANAGKTGDVANHTIRLLKDGVDAAPTNSPAEWSATNCPGKYQLTLTAAEATANSVTVAGKSSTGGVIILDVTVTFEQLPTAAPDAAGGLPVSDAGGLDLDTILADLPTVAEFEARTVAAATYATAAAVAAVKVDTAAILDDTGTAGVVVAAASKTGYALSSSGLDAVAVESGLNARQALAVVASACAGVLAGAATTTVTISAAGVSATNRITATVDESGNRSAVTLSLPA